MNAQMCNQNFQFNLFQKFSTLRISNLLLFKFIFSVLFAQLILCSLSLFNLQIYYITNHISNSFLNTNQQTSPLLSYKYFLAHQMTDVQSLTKNLTQIVANLMTMIQKNNSESLIPVQTGRIKKTSDMTYHEFLQRVLKNKTPVPVTVKKQNYRLQEDLQLLLALSNYGTITNKTFEQISNKKRINRTSESLRSRYHEHLYKVQENQMKKIVNWIQKQGVNGYLTFEQGEMRLSLSDGKTTSDDIKRQRPTSIDVQSKKTQKKTAKVKSVPTSCKQLNEVLRIYSKMVNLSVKDLLQKLDKLSGDLVQLDNYIETKDARLLWSPQQDQILKKGGPQLQILRKYRGNGVETRRKYLGLN